MKDFSYFTESWDNRVSVCNKYEKLFEKKYSATNLQNVKTPKFLINKMINKASSLKNKKILVMFNFEFVDALIHEYDVKPDMIYFVADCHKDMCKVIKLVYNLPINNIIYHSEYKDGSLTNELRKMSMKFDLCITNPPYNRGLDLKIIDAVKDICDEVVCVHPSKWILEINSEREIFNTIKYCKNIKSLEFFNGNPIFKIGLFVPTVITHIDKNKKDNSIFVKWFDEEYTVEDVDNITKYSKEWLTIIQPLYNKIVRIAEIDNVTNYAKSFSQLDRNNPNIFQGASIRGHVGITDDEMISDDFYTVVMRGEENIGIRKEIREQDIVYVEFRERNQLINFLNYLKTDFVRFCLTFNKYDSVCMIGSKICSLIPWLNFSQSWDDEKLFKHFEIDQETQNYIRKFLPDYYGIRKEKSPESIVKNIMQQYYCQEDNTNIFVNTEKDVEKPVALKTKISTSEEYVFYFYDEEMKDNFESFLNTKFVKFLKSIVKCNAKNEQQICIIPDMDFSEKWTDEKLMEYFNIPEDIRTYILNYE